jgi:hypothetical protein
MTPIVVILMVLVSVMMRRHDIMTMAHHGRNQEITSRCA